MFPNDAEIVSYFVNNKISSLKVKDLARGLQVPSSDYTTFRRHLKTLVESGLLSRSGKYYFVKQDEKGYSGVLRVNRGGFGFVSIPRGDSDFFIPSDEMSDGLDGDFVRIKKIGGFSRDGLPKGSVIEVIKIAKKSFIGLLHRRRDTWIIQVEGTNLGRDIFVSPVDGQLFEDGDRVEVEIIDRGPGISGLKGVVTKIIGDPEDPRNDFERVVRQYDLPRCFSSQVGKDFESRLKMFDAEILRRVDYREQKCFTIDPEDAKDFDDALYIEPAGGSGFRLWVHIADVSFFVTEGSKLDEEVCARGTSIYLIDRTIHMLPENLASNYCSLVPDEDRLAVSVCIEVNLSGEINGYSIEESVIRSSRRLTYDNVQSIIDECRTDISTESDLKKQINMLFELGRNRKKIRQSRGALDLDIPECKVLLDDVGMPIEIGQYQILDSNGIVEECMLLANECIGRFCSKNNLPVLYRVHEPPSESKFENIKRIRSLVGLKDVSSKQGVNLKDLQQLIRKTKNTENGGLVSKMVLRSLSRAEYTPNDVGHFGLSQNHYLHFTSPIRRFPDLLVHRIVKKKLCLEDSQSLIAVVEEERDGLVELGRYLSGRERHAEAASRAFLRIKALRYMGEHIGESYFGTVSGVLKSGFFVEIENVLVDGYCRLESMNERFEFDRDRFRIIGRRSRRIIQLGSQIKVLIVAVDYDSLEMELELIPEKRKHSGLAKGKSKITKKPNRKVSARRHKYGK